MFLYLCIIYMKRRNDLLWYDILVRRNTKLRIVSYTATTLTVTSELFYRVKYFFRADICSLSRLFLLRRNQLILLTLPPVRPLGQTSVCLSPLLTVRYFVVIKPRRTRVLQTLIHELWARPGLFTENIIWLSDFHLEMTKYMHIKLPEYIINQFSM